MLSLHQSSVGSGTDSDALTLVEYRRGADTVAWAAGSNRSVLAATLDAIIRAAQGPVEATY